MTPEKKTTAVEFQTMKVFDRHILDECRKLDGLVYGPQFIKDIELETALIKKNPRSRIITWHEKRVIGYSEYLPLTTEDFDLFLNTHDRVFDLLIEPDFISPWIKDVPVDLYGSSVVIHPDYQHLLIVVSMLRAMFLSLREIECEGFQIGRYGGTAVSKGGEKTAREMIGLTVSHEVPGGIAMVSNGKAVMAFLDSYLDF